MFCNKNITMKNLNWKQSIVYIESKSLHRCDLPFNTNSNSVIEEKTVKRRRVFSSMQKHIKEKEIRYPVKGETEQKNKRCEGEENKTVPGRQGQKPEYQEVGSGDRRLSGRRGEGAFSAQGTRVLKHPRLCLSRRTPSRSHGLCTGAREWDTQTTS